MLGYWGDEERTAESIDRAGWMHTGDLATIDGDGYCNIVGRIKDMVIRGGENVYPREESPMAREVMRSPRCPLPPHGNGSNDPLPMTAQPLPWRLWRADGRRGSISG